MKSHKGTVIRSGDGLVEVEMHVLSACASCEAHEKCAFVDKAQKVVSVKTPEWKSYGVGDAVTVFIGERMGITAVLLAYLMPAVVLVASLVTTLVLGAGEGMAALLSIGITALYFVVLYLIRDRLERKFTFTLQKD